MSCATPTLRILVFILNTICCIFAALSLSANAYGLTVYPSTSSVYLPCILGIVVASLLFLNTILGCCATLRESANLTWIYAVIMILLFSAQIALFFCISIDFNILANETITNAWNSELSSPGSMAQYEIQYGCCGKEGPRDYVDTGMSVPSSCYRFENVTNIDNLFTVGCIQKLTEVYAYNADVELISDWTLIGVEGTTVIIACMLAISLKNTERRNMFH